MSINTATISGNLGQDPEVKYFESGSVLATFSLAGKIYKNKKNETVWITCKAWGPQAELIGEALQKGSLVTASGQLDFEEWTDGNGKKQTKHVLAVRDIQLPPKQ